MTDDRCLNGRAPPYLLDYCVPATNADTLRHLRSISRQQYVVTGSTPTVAGPFQLLAPESGTLSRILSGTEPSVQTVSDVCLRRICLLDTSALSALEVLVDYCAI